MEKLKGQGDQAIAIEQIRCIALSCSLPLEQFLAKIQKFEKSLGVGKSAGRLKDAGRKVQYAFGSRDEVNGIRIYLSRHIEIINMRIGLLGLELLDVASETIDRNQEELRNSIIKSDRELMEVKSMVETLALASRENVSVLKKLFWVITAEIVAPLKSLSHTATSVW